MSYTMRDISGFAGSIWDMEFLRAIKKRTNIFPLFRNKAVPEGTASVKIPIFGTVSASVFVPGAGDIVTLDDGNQSVITLAVDKFMEYSTLVDDFEKLQSAVDDRQALVEQTVDALLLPIDTAVLTMCGAYTALPAAQEVSTSTAIDSSTEGAVYKEIERLMTQAHIVMDGTMGVGAGSRFFLTDTYQYHMLAKDSPKQAPERSDINFGAISGILNPFAGGSIYNAGTTSRSYDAYNDQTSIKFYLCDPDAIVVGVQKLPNVEVSRQALYKANLWSADSVYGLKEGVVGAIVECTLIVDGDLFGLE